MADIARFQALHGLTGDHSDGIRTQAAVPNGADSRILGIAK